MTSRTEDVIGGIAASLDALKPEPGEFLILRLAQLPQYEAIGVLQEWLKENVHVPTLLITPDADVKACTADAMGLELWGSDCGHCGNTTPDSQRCELCGSTRNTRRMWVEKK